MGLLVRRRVRFYSHRFHGLAAATSLTVALATLAIAVPASAEDGTAPSPDASSAVSPSDGDEVATADGRDAASEAALAEAEQSGQPVVVDQLTAPTQLVTATPAGYFIAELTSDVARVRDWNGDWLEIDPTLQSNDDGTLSPRAVQGTVVFSGGGSAGSVLASVAGPGFSYSILAPATLPTPTVSGDTALYSDVFPDVDLVLKATTAGFGHSWVVKTPEAAADPFVRSLAIDVTSVGLQPERQAGGVAYLDSDGVQQLWTPTPTMWDSTAAGSGSDDQISDLDATDAAMGPDQGDQVATVATQTDASSLTLKPDVSILDDPNTVFPVVIDPYVSDYVYRNGWTAVWDNFPAKSFWQTDHSLGAGYEGYEQFKHVRSYFRFDTQWVSGKYIVAAEADVEQIHDASCSARPTQMYRTGTISPKTTWNNQPTRFGLQDTNSSTVGCGSGYGFVGWDVTTGVRTVADAGQSSVTFMIRAQDETDKIAWKQFDDYHAKLEVKFVSTPKRPSNLNVLAGGDPFRCVHQASGAPELGTAAASVKLRGTVESPDGSSANLDLNFERVNVTTGSTPTDLTTGPGLASGDQGAVAWTSLVSVRTYKFRAYSRAYWTYQGDQHSVSSPKSDWCYFVFDTTKPPPPTIVSSPWTACGLPDTPNLCTATGTSHTSGSITVDDMSASNDAEQYIWSMNGGSEHTVATSSGAARTFTATPSQLLNTLMIWSVDGSGNTSQPREFIFRVNPVLPRAAWSFDTATPTANEGSSGTSESDLTLNGGTVDPRGRVGKGLRITGAQPATDSATTVDTTGDFTASGWFRVEGTQPATVFAAPGASNNAFEITYTPSTHTWTAGHAKSASNTALEEASATAGANAVWTHVAATYDASASTLTLYVAGLRRNSVTYTSSAWANSGGWWIGCGRVGASPSACTTGYVDEVRLYDNVLSAAEIADLADPIDGDNHAVLADAGIWDMEDPATSVGAADSVFGNDLAVTQVASPFGTGADGATTGVLRLPGQAAQAVSRQGPVVDAWGSFSVSAMVNLADDSTTQVIAQQMGTNAAAWTLEYRAASAGGGQFVFSRSSADSTTATTTEVRNPLSQGVAGTWQFVTGVYDRAHDELRLYVGGATFTAGSGSTSTDALPTADFDPPWQGRAALRVGNGTDQGSMRPLNGDIAAVIVQAGAIDNQRAVDVLTRCADGICGN